MELGRMTWPEARELFDESLVAIQPVGATEPHGPHLPLDTDVTIAKAQALRSAELLAAEGVKAVVLPPLAYGLTRFTEGFEGRISLRPGTLWAILEDLAESLGEQGVRRIVLANAHLEPEHVRVLRGIAKDFPVPSAQRPHVLFPDNTRRRWAGTLGDEFASGDCHAGRYESSIVLARDPGGVREDKRVALPPLEIGLIEAFQGGKSSFRAMGADEAYCGDPAAASAAEGERLIDSLADMTFQTIREAWPELFR